MHRLNWRLINIGLCIVVFLRGILGFWLQTENPEAMPYWSIILILPVSFLMAYFVISQRTSDDSRVGIWSKNPMNFRKNRTGAVYFGSLLILLHGFSSFLVFTNGYLERVFYALPICAMGFGGFLGVLLATRHDS